MPEMLESPATPKFGWWGDEGGHRLDVECFPDGRLQLTVTTAHQPPSTVTLSTWRALQFWQWYNRVSPPADSPVYDLPHGEQEARDPR